MNKSNYTLHNKFKRAIHYWNSQHPKDPIPVEYLNTIFNPCFGLFYVGYSGGLLQLFLSDDYRYRRANSKYLGYIQCPTNFNTHTNVLLLVRFVISKMPEILIHRASSGLLYEYI